MSVLNVRIYGDPVLREKAEPVGEAREELRALASDMAETMYANDGIGLAGNQVGVLKRIVVLDASEDYTKSKRNGKRTPPAEPQYEVLLDPEIVESSLEDCEYKEGCLSIPGVEGKVYRPARIRARWMDLEGRTHEEEMVELKARILQHEIDHLNGVLFVDHMTTGARARLAGKLKALREGAAAGTPGSGTEGTG